MTDQLGGNDLEFVLAHGFDGAVVRGECVLESYFVIGQTEIATALICFLELLRQFDQLVDDLLSSDRSIVILV